MSLPFLQTLGLTEKESTLYELLLTLGELPAQKLITESRLKRATVYKTLYSLEAKGLVSHKDVAKKIHFRPEPPARLIELSEAKHHDLERAQANLRSILPQLTSSYILSVERPVVSTFEGVRGLKEIYEDTLKEKKPIYAYVQVSTIDPRLHSWLDRSYVKRRAKHKIHAYVIMPADQPAKLFTKRDTKEERSSILVPKQKFPFQHEINIYGDKVAFINNKAGSRLIGIVIRHPEVAATMKACFDLAWEGAKTQFSKQSG